MPDYMFDFGDISDRWVETPVNVVSNVGRTPIQGTIRVSLDDEPVVTSSLRRIPAKGADLLDLAIATFIADRRSKRLLDKHRQLNAHKIDVRLPLRDADCFQRFQDDWAQLLFHYTQDNWSFNFIRRYGLERTSGMQTTLWQQDEDVEVALFSGGLDSMAGLINRIARNPAKKYVLVGGGANQGAFEAQRNVKAAVQQQFPETSLLLVQIQIHQKNAKAFSPDADFRARGLIFILLGAACALAHGQRTLYIYENSIGAHNFPPRRASVGLDHAVAVHPYSLLRVGDFISSVLGREFSIVNPFETYTKAQMCAILNNYDLLDAIALTVSCDKASYGHPQCGGCSSCILRRQSLHSAGIEDRTQYITTHPSNLDERNKVLQKSHLPAMLHGVHKLEAIFHASDPWQEFKIEYPSRGWDAIAQIAKRTGRTEADIAFPILRAHQVYVEEWNAIEDDFADELNAIRQAIRIAEAEKKGN